MWESIVASAVGGVVAALAFAFVVHCWRRCQGCKEAAAIREIIVRYRRLVLGAEDLSHPAGSPDLELLPDRKRALVYNRMLGEVGRTLDRWLPHLPLKQRQSLLDALDWFHTKGGLVFISPVGVLGYRETLGIAPGRWRTEKMSLDQAKAKFAELEAVKWLKLPKAESSD